MSAFAPRALRALTRTPATRSFIRHNSSTTTTSSGAARLADLARAADKPSPLEASVPVMWAVSGALIWTAFQRVEGSEGRGEGVVEKLIVV